MPVKLKPLRILITTLKIHLALLYNMIPITLTEITSHD